MAAKSSITYDQYLENLRTSRILEDEELASALAEFQSRPAGEAATVERLSEFLQESGRLTSWQHRRLASGVTKGFFLGQYKLLRRLGAGGMGSVYLAQHTMMDRLAALKVISATQVGAAALQRFRRESQVVASLDHPHIVRAHDYNRHGKYHYLVMEYVEGVDLDRYVNKVGPLSPGQAAELTAQAADGLHFAHQSGVVHRDVKPSNLMLDRSRKLKILDLGLARMERREAAELTSAQAGVIGTVDFIAPEQAMDGHRVDARADVYGLGCTLYFLLTGRVPFPGGSVAQKLMGHACGTPTPIKSLRADVPDDLVEICERMTAKKPEQRFQTAEEVRVALQGFLFDLESTSQRLDFVQADLPWADGPANDASPSAAAPQSADTLIAAMNSTAPFGTFDAAPAPLSPSKTLGLSAESLSGSAEPTPAAWNLDPAARPPAAPIRAADPLGLDADDLTSSSSWPIDPNARTIASGLQSSDPAKSETLPVDAWEQDPRPAAPRAPETNPFRALDWRSGDRGAERPPTRPSFGSSPRPSPPPPSSVDDMFAFLTSDSGAGSSILNTSDSSMLTRAPGSEIDPESSSLSFNRPPGANFSLSSMIVKVVCPYCRARLAVAGGAAKDALDCPKCGKRIPK